MRLSFCDVAVLFCAILGTYKRQYLSLWIDIKSLVHLDWWAAEQVEGNARVIWSETGAICWDAPQEIRPGDEEVGGQDGCSQDKGSFS